ncbi:MAG: serine protease [Pseudobdellovibrionaceae bacterium]|nr:serine protease [Pseudobdellovibrionaceae bacterium]
MIRHAMSLCAIVMITACQPAAQNSVTHSIIDQDSMVEVEADTPLPHQGLKKDFPAIGRMTGGCTAFHLGNGLVATAGHCVQDLAANPVEASCHSMDITWGVLADADNNTERSRCMKVLDYKYDQEADYALLQVDPIPATAVALERDPRGMQFTAQAIVVGYPKGRALSVSANCIATLESDPQSQIFHHRCDTLPGNSGSPVLNAATLEVIGVHNGDADNSENYGSYLPVPDALSLMAESLSAGPVPQSLQFGPFADQLKKDLVHFTREQGAFVSFHLTMSVEDGYDKVVVIDGLGRTQELTGNKDQQFQKLPTPVSVVVLTDYSGTSQSVALDSIHAE